MGGKIYIEMFGSFTEPFNSNTLRQSWPKTTRFCHTVIPVCESR